MSAEIANFQTEVYEYYLKHQRVLPWRIPDPSGSFEPYRILISELMLQQTQVKRVIPKFAAFMHRFPTLQDLAKASLADVLIEWSGLGYNRRARFLHQAAGQINTEYSGKIPQTVAELIRLPGIGPNTAAAMLVYSFNQPEVFIETNIRTVFLHHFFADQEGVSDQQLLPFIQQALDRKNPRHWYWALMDYGTYLKQTLPNPSRRSKHHTKQSAFVGSKRFVRGQVIKLLTREAVAYSNFLQVIQDDRLKDVLDDLVSEGMITEYNQTYRLAR
jgi:A/G-specific adenine glycosylase